VIFSYRLLFHPLRAFPGPLVAKLSDAYNGYFAFTKRLHLTAMEDHSTYGPVMRHGPNKLLFNSATALHGVLAPVQLIDGPRKLILPVDKIFMITTSS
jgi:hypothetical protein